MGRRRSALLTLGLSATVLVAAEGLRESFIPSEVVIYRGAAKALRERLSWAAEEASKGGPDREYWVGYSVRRLMGENSVIGSDRAGRDAAAPTVEDILSGRRRSAALGPLPVSERRTRREVAEALEEGAGSEENKVPKDIAFFFLYRTGRPPSLVKVRFSNLDLVFEFGDRPLFWAGGAGDRESLDCIRALYAGDASEKVKENLVAAAGLHGDGSLVIPFLERILTGNEAPRIRKAAAFWIGQQDEASGLALLVRAARSDASAEVRESAVFAISQVKAPAAVDELIALARGASQPDVRKHAVFWLGQMASKKAVPVLEEFARGDGDAEVQEQAVFALSQLPDNQGVEPLIKLAKTHPDPRIRKRAIFWLGECKDPRALDALIAIIKGK
jgi:HEAT repeat protein